MGDNTNPILVAEGSFSVPFLVVNYPVLTDRACKSPIDQPQLS